MRPLTHHLRFRSRTSERERCIAGCTLHLNIAIWENSCLGDVSRDGRTDDADLIAMLEAAGTCRGHPRFNPDADLDKDGCVGLVDLLLLTQDVGCSATAGGSQMPGDLNCDGVVDFGDVNPFVTALGGEAAYSAQYPHCNWLNADVNRDGWVNTGDISPFVNLLTGH